MRAGAQISLSLDSYLKAFDFIFKHGLWYYFIYPVVIAFLLFTGGILLMQQAIEAMQDWLRGLLGLDADPDSWLMASLGWLVSLTVGFIMGWIFYLVKSSFVKYGTLIILSPVLAHLSEKTEQIITGSQYPFNMQQFIRDVVRGILMALRNFAIEFSFIVICFFVSLFIPVLGALVSMVVLWLVSWYFYGFSMIDYSNERKKLTVSQSTAFARKHKWLCIGSGFWFWLMWLIPWIGVVVSPVVGVVASTLAVNEVTAGGEKKA